MSISYLYQKLGFRTESPDSVTTVYLSHIRESVNQSFNYRDTDIVTLPDGTLHITGIRTWLAFTVSEIKLSVFFPNSKDYYLYHGDSILYAGMETFISFIKLYAGHKLLYTHIPGTFDSSRAYIITSNFIFNQVQRDKSCFSTPLTTSGNIVGGWETDFTLKRFV